MFKLLKAPRHVWRALHLFAYRRNFGNRFLVAPTARIASPGRINLLGSSSTLRIGSNVQIEEDTWLNVKGALTIGEGSYISVRCVIGCETEVNIGNHVAIGPNVTIIDTTKNYSNLAAPIIHQGGSSMPVSIGGDSWIGANAVILSGTEIGKHCVVAAGSVVKGQFPDNTLIAGSPAKVIRSL